MTIQEAIKARTAPLKQRYANFIGGRWVDPVDGRWFDNRSPIDGQVICQVARSQAADIELALDAAHKAKDGWGRTSVAERALILHRIADRMEENLSLLATAETWDNGKPIRETTAADLPLAIDHFRYFAGCIRAQEGGISEIDHDTVAYHFHEPLGVVGQIIPWNFPLLMACWKLAPALAAGNCVVLKPAEQTPASIMVLAELIADLLPEGVLNIVNGYGVEAGKPLAQNSRIAKIAFTGETTTGQLIMSYASENLIPVTLELGGKSPNIFFSDVAAKDDDYFDKAIEGFAMFALNQGEVCTCPSRALVHESIYDRFMEKAVARVEAMIQGDPLDPATMVGAQASQEQMDKILGYLDIGRDEGAKVLTGGTRNRPEGLEGWRAITSSQPCSAATTKCGCSRRRFSAPSSRSRPSRTMRKRCASPTTRFTAWARACGRATAPAPIAWAARSRRAACGPTATTPIPPMRRSAATSAPASDARRTA